ncbi:sulfotransferase 1C2-like [Lingula anatina]|uniref:Sulfotransferase 1C2-like n=1 Tax=Lingula anatina TaxID=7574 RepID=A0A1S3HHX5_LINAN|nr:sulfotransferase 1C2-like [Lingula anatina]|eukprot:XP_013385710.1 sulfotransferase 1C2-like [Lingula anatina]
MYEEMKRDPVSHVQKISDFLGQPLDQDVCMKIAKECRFESMQAKKHDFLEKFIESSDKNIWRKGATGMYRKGAVGDWKNHFTVSQNERFDALIRECMKDCDMQLTYE